MLCSAVGTNQINYPSSNVDKILLPGVLIQVGSNRECYVNLFIDDGCSTLALMSEDFVTLNNISTITLPYSTPVRLADGGFTNHPITHQTLPIKLSIGTHTEIITFLVLKNLRHPVLLGLPWMQLHNPAVNWRSMVVHFSDPHCIKAHLEASVPCQIQCITSRSDVLPSTTLLQEQTDVLLTEPVLLNCDDFINLVDQEKLDIFVVHFEPPTLKGNKGISICEILPLKEYTKSSLTLDSRGVPEQYLNFADVFAPKSEPKPLPPHRPYDLRINLEANKPLPLPHKIYPLSPPEEIQLKEYIEKALSRGWIIPSDSPVGAPCFFVKKADGGLRLCVDYRGINNITVKDSYPLPLIQDLLDKLQGANIFTQLDMPDAYHLLRIAPGHEWKSAFRCKFGTYNYQVVRNSIILK